MTGFFKKLMAAGMALSMGLASYGSADYVYSNGYNNGFNNGCCPQPSCDPCGSWCDNLSFSAAFLYWKLNGDEFDYVAEKVGSSIGTPAVAGYDQRIHHVNFNYDPGFRLGLGFVVPSWGWGVDVKWTHFDTKSSSNEEVNGAVDPFDVSVSIPSLPGFPGVLAAADTYEFRGHVDFKYDTVDLEFGKWCCCGNGALLFRPHVGLRFADIREEFEIEGVFVDGDLAIAANEFEARNTFKGVGIRAGLELDLRLCDGWSIVGHGAIAAVYGSNNIRTTYEQVAAGSVGGTLEGDTRENYKATRAFADYRLGVRYKTVACGCYPISIEAAWEQQFLWSQHRYFVDRDWDDVDSSDVRWKKNGNVGIQGLTLTAGFDF